jgi:fluoroacetyl-CoA thioesterase
MRPKPGLSAKVELVVTDDDTAIALRSGSVPVLATPRVIALCEEATVLALEGTLTETETSVGMRIQLDHVNPTAVGGNVFAEATLTTVEGRRLTFTVNAHDARGLIAVGKVTRVIVDYDRFMEKAL